MSGNLGAAIVVGVALIIATFIYRGIYEFHYAETSPAYVAYRLNRFTGRVGFCNGIKDADNEVPYGCSTLRENSN